MPRVRFCWSALKETKFSEYVARFIFGGLATAAVGWVAHVFGPVVGGLFLAFPAILPASLTLAARHDGRTQAADEARGAVAGSAGLVAFGLVVWLAAPVWSPVIMFACALLAWIVVSVVVWRVTLT